MNAKILLAAAAIFAAFNANTPAAVISHDWHAPGDGLLTYDTISHREWLDLSQTDGEPLTTVEQSLQPGGILFGFHRATAADVSAFVASAGYIGTSATSDQDYSIANSLIDILGQDFTITITVNTVSFPGYGYTPVDLPEDGSVERIINGLALRSATFNTLEPFTIVTVHDTGSGPVRFKDSYTTSHIGTGIDSQGDFTSITVGASWLYRNAPVPEPTTSALFAFVTCVASLRRRPAQSANRSDIGC